MPTMNPTKHKVDLQGLQRQLSGQKQFRALADVRRDTIDKEARTVEIAWASEEPYRRWYGDEILDCKASSIRLGRLNDGASLLFNHKLDELIGVVESVTIGADRICRAVVRFDTSDEAEKRFQQVLNGVLKQISVGYMVHIMVLEKEEEGRDATYRVTDWEPYELSFVTVAADYSVGVGRSADSLPTDQQQPAALSTKGEPATLNHLEIRSMPATTEDQAQQQQQQRQQPAPAGNPTTDSVAADTKRRDAIIELGVRYSDYLTLKDVQDACTKGHGVEAVQQLVMERLATKHSDTRQAHIGLSEQEAGRYSIARAVRAMLVGDWKDAGLEREASEAAAKKFSMGSSKSLLIPFDVMARRDFLAGTGSQAGNLISTDLRLDLFADVLRNRLALGRLGATMLFGLGSNVDIPKLVSGSQLGFVTEIAGAAETQPSTGKISLGPKRISAYVDFSKQAVIQSAMAVEPLLRQDILSEYQVQTEYAAINGAGAGGVPLGLRYTPGIGAVIGGTNGAQLGWNHVVGLESACANVNAEPDANSGYLINTRTRGWTKQARKGTDLPFIWDNGPQPLNGYRAEVTNNVLSNLDKGTAVDVCSSVIFGANWPMLVVATFGAIELLVDETSQAVNGLNRLVLNAFVDSGVRRAADFAIMEDALTN